MTLIVCSGSIRTLNLISIVFWKETCGTARSHGPNPKPKSICSFPEMMRVLQRICIVYFFYRTRDRIYRVYHNWWENNDHYTSNAVVSSRMQRSPYIIERYTRSDTSVTLHRNMMFSIPSLVICSSVSLMCMVTRKAGSYDLWSDWDSSI